MEELRTWREVLIEQLADDRAEAIGYLKLSIEEYQVDGDTPLLLLSLRTFVESQGGISELAKKTGINSQDISKILSGDKPPSLDILSAILKAFGCRISIELVEEVNPDLVLTSAD